MDRVSVGVIGGGAAGMMAAVTAARQGACVTLLERNDRIGRKILMTGNGRCNFGNRELSEKQYYGAEPAWIRGCLERFGTQDAIRFFQGLGILVKEREGYLYPSTGQASTVLDAFRYELNSLGVKVITQCRIRSVEAKGRKGQKGRILCLSSDAAHRFDRVIISCGGQAAPKTGSEGDGYRLAKGLGHTIVPVAPGLVQLRCREDYFKSVAGVRAEAELSLMCGGKCEARERGELQLAEYGISGIPVFQLSRRAAYLLREQREVTVRICLLPDMDEEACGRFLDGRLLLLGERTVEEFFTGIVHKKILQLFLRLSGLRGEMPVRKAKRESLLGVLALCRAWEVTVTNVNSFEHAQVSAGGVCCLEVTKEMESRLVPGIYFAGEVLDVDGRCGGYNLHWAWCSGYLAGGAAAERDGI